VRTAFVYLSQKVRCGRYMARYTFPARGSIGVQECRV